MPDWSREIRLRLANMRLAPARETEIVEELAQHLDDRCHELLGQGMTRDEATELTLRELSESELLARELRRIEGSVWQESTVPGNHQRLNMIADLWQDIRYGVRVLRKNPWFTLIAVLTLSLGICGVTTQFSILDATLFRGLPFPEQDRLVRVTVRDPSWDSERERNPWLSDAVDFDKQQHSFEGLASYQFAAPVMVNISGVPQRLSGCLVTANFFRVLGVTPRLGRDFTDSDDRGEAEPVTIISNALWQSEFGGNAEIIGRKVHVMGRAVTVVGVMPPGFEFPRDQLWIPMFNQYPNRARPGGPVQVLGRLKPGVSFAQGQAELDLFMRRMANEYPETNKGLVTARLAPLLDTFIPKPTRQLLFSMLAAVLAVLLIACANVMNMQFARATVRASEFAMRTALGASRFRLVRQLLTESLIVGMIGAVAGIVLTYWAIDLFSGVMGQLPVNVTPFWMRFYIDWRVLAITLVCTMASVVLSGLLPAILASRINLAGVINSSARGNTSSLVSRLTTSLVVGQIGLTCALLIVSLLLIKSVTNQSTLTFGFNLDALVAGRINFDAEYKFSERQTAYRSLLMHLRSSPQFTHAALTSRRLMMTNDDPSSFEIEGLVYQRPEDRLSAWEEVVSDGYFDVLGLSPVEGREFQATDRDERRFVALVNQSFAQRYFAGSPIGKRIRRHDRDQWRTIVGVVPDTLMQGPIEQQRDGSAVFFPIEADPRGTLTLVVRGNAPPAQMIDVVRREILKVNPNLGIYVLDTPRNLLKSLLVQSQTMATLFAVFGGVAMLLAAVGLYGITAYSVNRRTQEFGIRMALGSDRRRILFLVLRQSGVQFIIGAMLGVGLTVALVRLGRSVVYNFLYQVNPYDPVIYGMVIGLLGVAMLVACLVPARRATKVDPLIALRSE